MQNIKLEDFRFSAPLIMRWNDLDPLGHVNNVIFFDYFQNARGNYIHAVSKNWNWNKDMFIIAHIECDYFIELKLDAINPVVMIRTSMMSNKSFELEYLIVSKSKDAGITIHAKGKSVQVMFDMSSKVTMEIPSWFRKDVIDYEGVITIPK